MCASSAPVFPLAEILVRFSYDDGGDDDYDGGVFLLARCEEICLPRCQCWHSS